MTVLFSPHPQRVGSSICSSSMRIFLQLHRNVPGRSLRSVRVECSQRVAGHSSKRKQNFVEHNLRLQYSVCIKPNLKSPISLTFEVLSSN